MRYLLLIACLACGCGTIRSQIEIDPGDQFVLGGSQRGAFMVDLLNVGAAPVDVVEVSPIGDSLLIARLVPGASASAAFQAGAAALIINRSTLATAVQATIRGDTNLGMDYRPIE